MIRLTKQFITRHWSLMLVVSIFLAAPPAGAQDIEVYYNNQGGGGTSNVLFMFDTSGSMAWCADGSSVGHNGCTADQTRINQLKRAFSNLIDGLGSNVRVGEGRLYSDQGGYIIYPVRGLDEHVPMVVSDSIKTNNDDAVETSGTMTVNSSTIEFPSGGVAGGQTGFIFRSLKVPRYAQITGAKLVVDSKESTSTNLDMTGSYQVGPALADLSTQDLSSRSLSGGTNIKVTSAWGYNQTYDVDVTDLVQKAVNDTSWCGSDDMLLAFTNDNSSANFRKIGADTQVWGQQPVKLEVTWQANTSITPGTPGTSGYESTLSCTGGLTQSLGDLTNDAEQDDATHVHTAGTFITLTDNYIGGFRFPNIKYDTHSGTYPDVVNSATLRLPGAGSETTQSQQVCVDTYRWNRVVADSYCSSGGGGGGNNCHGFWCWFGGGWGGGGSNRYQWQNQNVTSPITSGTVNIKVNVISGDAATIQAQDNNIGGRTVLASKSYTVSADNNTWSNLINLDVTSLVSQALGNSNWASGDALMFNVIATDASGRQFKIASQDGSGSGATLELGISSATQDNFAPLVRDKLKEAVNNLQPGGGTPLAESYDEMARYMMGDEPYFGDGSSGHAQSNPESISNDKYLTPVDPSANCTSNAIVLMTDGEPNDYNDESPTQTTQIEGASNKVCSGSFDCMDNLATWLDNPTKNSMKAQVKTHTVGFDLTSSSRANLKAVADNGEGLALAATDAQSLEDAFRAVINSTITQYGSMSAPGVAVNQLNRFQFLNQLYYAVFKPSMKSVWQGNVKRYKLDATTNPAKIVDQVGVPAVDPQTGFFKDTASSWWKNIQDGPDVAKGGAYAQLTNRKLFVATSSPGVGSNPLATSQGSETTLTQFNAYDAVPATALGLSSSATQAQRQTLYNYLLGAWGDPLHSEPRLVNYGYSGTLQQAYQDPSLQDNTVFVGTNTGMLHAIDVSDGSEQFSFMPAETLSGTATRQQNPDVTQSPWRRSTYGLDGSWTPWRIGASDGSAAHVYLYGGMRRGGRNYYALDATDRSNPKLMWEIQGGTGDFTDLGQTWSDPTLTEVKVNGTEIPVLVFGGGYSPSDEDTAGVTNSGGDSVGNAIYIVNAFTGAVLWEGSSSGADTNNSDMKWAIPGAVSVVDYDFDGNADFIYAADMGGQVFRVDIDNGNSGLNGLVKDVTTVAKLGISNAGGISNDRRFYYPPVISLGKRNGQKVLQVSIGSGYRSHPLDKQTQDRMYVFNDEGAIPSLSGGTTTQTVVTPSDLLNVTSNMSPTQSQLDSSEGWYINLNSNGEKVLASPAVLQGKVYFTTYLPDRTTNLDSCSSVIGDARLYVVNITDGTPAGDFNNDGTVDSSRYTAQNLKGLPPQPQVLVGVQGGASGGGTTGTGGGGGTPSSCQNGSGDIIVLTGTSVANGGTLKGCGMQKTRWYQEKDKTSADQLLNSKGAVPQQ